MYSSVVWCLFPASMAPYGIGRGVLVRWNRDCTRKMSDAPPPHLLVVGARNSRIPGPARLRQKAKRGARWRLQPIGEEIVRCIRHHRCSLEHPPVYRDIISEKGEELLGAQRTGGRKEARSWRVVATNPVHNGGVVRETAATAIGVQEDTRPYTSRRGARRHAAPQEGDRGVVAEAKPQGTAS